MTLKAFDPSTYAFTGHPERITLHWTGGSYTPSSLDAEHYQFLIDGDGKVWCGNYSIEDQDSTSTNYAAHTKGFNSKNIGVSLCGMAGAQENGTFGEYPITGEQWNAAISLCAQLMRIYKLRVTMQTLASHCEIQNIHGKPQNGKWDISAVDFLSETWLELNDIFREEVAESLEYAHAIESAQPVTRIHVPQGTIVDVFVGLKYPVRVQ